ncbi:MAG: RNA polymerase sigma factor [Isosphaeraceae bacterium]
MRKSVQTGSAPATERHDRGQDDPDPGASTDLNPELLPRGDASNVTTPPSSPDSVPALAGLCLEDEEKLHDAWLVERSRHGDHVAFAVLVHRYERKLVRVLARLVRDPELARDLAQETFWRVYERLERFDTARRFGPWLFRVGVNLGLDWLRSNRSEPSSLASIDRSRADGELPFELPDPDPRIQADLAQEVQHVLAQLPVSYRTILVLRDLEGFPTSEVAAIVGRQEATVRWRLAKARDKFRQIWERRLEAWNSAAMDG